MEEYVDTTIEVYADGIVWNRDDNTWYFTSFPAWLKDRVSEDLKPGERLILTTGPAPEGTFDLEPGSAEAALRGEVPVDPASVLVSVRPDNGDLVAEMTRSILDRMKV